MKAAACSWRVTTSLMVERRSASMTSRFSSHGTPKISRTPSFSSAATNSSAPFIGCSPQVDRDVAAASPEVRRGLEFKSDRLLGGVGAVLRVFQDVGSGRRPAQGLAGLLAGETLVDRQTHAPAAAPGVHLHKRQGLGSATGAHKSADRRR